MTTVAARPVLSAPAPWSFPTFGSQQLDNGLEVLVSPMPTKPLASAEVTLTHSSAHDPAGKEGLAVLVASLLDEGTDELSAEQFSDRLESIGALWYVEANSFGTTVGVEVPSVNLGPALALVAQALTSAQAPEAEFERVRNDRLNAIRSSLASAPGQAAFAFAGALWAPGSRAADLRGGSRASLESLTREDVLGVVAGYSPRGARLVMAGDFTLEQGRMLADQAFGHWRAPANPEVRRADTARQVPVLRVVDRPGSVQTELVLGSLAPGRAWEHWSDLQVGSHVLGGTLTSRIDARLREEKGYTYGMRSGFEVAPGRSAWKVSGSVEGRVTQEAVSDLLGILAGIAGDVTDSEVRDASQYLVGISPLRWENPAGVVNHMGSVLGEGLGADWTDRHLAAMAAATSTSVNTALTALALDGPSLVAVGDAGAISGPLAELTDLPVEVVEHLG